MKNIYINNLDKRTTVYGIAASNKKSTSRLVFSYGNTGGAFVITDSERVIEGNEVIEIQTDLVDNVLPEDIIVDFALIDV
jgi:hypothetical protein